MSAILLNHFATAIAQSHSWERMRYILLLMQLLAKGSPVSGEQLATVLQQPVAEVTEELRRVEDLVFDEEGRVVSAGISLQPTPYHFEVNGHHLYTWCALDTLLFPAWLEQTAQVVSSCPATGTSISLTVTPKGVEQLDPPGGVISLLIPDGLAACCQDGLATCCTIRDTFCAYSQFFSSREAASTWHAQHPDGHVLSIEEASRLAQTLVRLTMQQLQERGR